MNKCMLEEYWSFIPVGKENALDYHTLRKMWGCPERAVRAILHKLSAYDNGDDYILIRSSRCNGFYKTDNPEEIAAYRQECINRGRNVFAPLTKINRVMNVTADQYSFTNNLRVVRESKGMKQGEVCEKMQQYNRAFDKSLLSKMENGYCCPTPYQLLTLAQIYGVEPEALGFGF